MVLLVYPPEGGGRINHNTTTKGVIKYLLPLIGRCGGNRARKWRIHPNKAMRVNLRMHNVPFYRTPLSQANTIDADRSRERLRERMAETFRLEVEGWDSETLLQDSASESSTPGDGPSASA